MPFVPVTTRAARALTCAALLCAGAALPAPAQDLYADTSRFNLFNDSGRPMIAFAVALSSGDYTANQLETPLQPGTGLTLDLEGLLDDSCDHATRIVWEDGVIQDLTVPYCTIAALFLSDKDVSFD